jgi:DNA-binding XRE family transcriptional regulator
MNLRFFVLLLITYCLIEYFVFRHYRKLKRNRRYEMTRQHVDRKALGQRIRTVRERLDMNVREFGDYMNVSRTSISNYELGSALPSLEFMQRLAEIEQTTIDDLIK